MAGVPSPDHDQRAEWLRIIAERNRELERCHQRIAELEAELAAERRRTADPRPAWSR